MRYTMLLLGGLVVGTLDISYAILFWWLRSNVRPSRIFQSVAAGVLGPAAMRGGLRATLLGAFLHYFIALAVVIVYWIMSRFLPLLIQRPIVCGAIYGVLVYLVMNYVVIPLSATRRGPFIVSWVVCTVIVHVIFIGIPAALFARAAGEG
jgi:hypothetical protein